MIGIIGKKLGMTQIFNEQGQQIPCTVVEAPPNSGAHGHGPGHGRHGADPAGLRHAAHAARQRARASARPRGRRALAAADRSRREGGPHRAAARAAQLPPRRRTGQEARDPDLQGRRRRSTSASSPSATPSRSPGTSKGRGFQGVVKRHGFGGGPNTHGNTKHRRPGSIGPGTDPSRVIKGKKMPGHYGAEQHTQTHLRVEKHRCRAHPALHPRLGRRSQERDRHRPQAGIGASHDRYHTTGPTSDAHDLRRGDVYRTRHAARRPSRCPASCSTAR